MSRAEQNAEAQGHDVLTISGKMHKNVVVMTMAFLELTTSFQRLEDILVDSIPPSKEEIDAIVGNIASIKVHAEKYVQAAQQVQDVINATAEKVLSRAFEVQKAIDN